MNKIVKISFILLTLISCGRNDKTVDREKQQDIQKQNKKIISKLTEDYHLKFKWDTLHFNYSVQYDKVIESGYQLIDDFVITDIYRKDSISYVSLRVWSWPTFYFDLIVSGDIIDEIIDYHSMNNSEIHFDGVLVVKITEVKKIKLKIESYPEDESYCNLEFDHSGNFIGKGEIIDLIIIN